MGLGWATATRIVLILALAPGPVDYPRPEGSGRPGQSCTLDRHCGPGLGCHVPSQRCATLDQIADVQRRDLRGDVAFVVPVGILGLGLLAVGGVFASPPPTRNVPAAVVGLSIGSLLTLIGIGGAAAIGIKHRRHRARLLEISRRPTLVR